MAQDMRVVDIDDAPDLARLAEEVRASNEPRILRRGNEDIAVLMPVKHAAKRRAGRAKTEADLEAFRSAAGGWKDVDTDKLIRDIYTDRAMSDRPPIEL